MTRVLQDVVHYAQVQHPLLAASLGSCLADLSIQQGAVHESHDLRSSRRLCFEETRSQKANV